MDSEIGFDDRNAVTDVRRGSTEFLGTIGDYSGEVSFQSQYGLCQYGPLVGRRYTAAELRKIADKIDEVKRKSDVEVLVVACEATMTLKQFPMVQDPPVESPLVFNGEGTGYAGILKEGHLIGAIRTRGPDGRR
ncbi:MAG: hypothetical protein UX58_C0003G0071 [Candidatus Wolfebacteria bacterium GW2011_GWB2_46_69]|nr:MAG: hypothetical protein UX58_C0003G0071 [Candidatus Wolfebacteria bacterium GW2011_GWB2_46_69]